jgi:hypothetical protein
MGRFSTCELIGLESGEGEITRLEASVVVRSEPARGVIAGAVLGRLDDALLLEA